jgi:hypothetical protein
VVVDRSSVLDLRQSCHTFTASGGWSWCSAGHEKGYYYVPGKEEEDGWGYFIPVDPSTKGAVKAMVDLHGAVDGYEISSVFLGAQYMAQLGEKSAVRKMFAAAEKAKLPILGLSAKEAEKIKMPHEPEAVQEARSKFGAITEDGVVKWTDEAVSCGRGIPTERPTTSCASARRRTPRTKMTMINPPRTRTTIPMMRMTPLRMTMMTSPKMTTTTPMMIPTTMMIRTTIRTTTTPRPAHKVMRSHKRKLHSMLHNSGSQTHKPRRQRANKDMKDTTKEASISAKNVLSAALAAKLPKEITDQLATAPGSGLETVLSACSKMIKSQAKNIRTLTPKAELGENYIKEVTADAVHWYTVSRRDPKNPEKGVNVDFAKQMIDRCEGDVELIKALAKDWKSEAQAKFPQSTRRSAVSDDPNERTKAMPDVPFGPESEDRQTEKVVSRLHRTGRE